MLGQCHPFYKTIHPPPLFNIEYFNIEIKILLQAKLNSAKLDLATHFIVVMVDITEGSLKVKIVQTTKLKQLEYAS